jgi:hypothetical protein
MSKTPLFDSMLADYPGIHRAAYVFPQPTPEPHISFIKERGAWAAAIQILEKPSLLTSWLTR